jgi:predicted O-methyltransferase YrrM
MIQTDQGNRARQAARPERQQVEVRLRPRRAESKRDAGTIDLWDCALGFMDSQILLTAEELGVFDCLDGGSRSAAEIAAATGLPEGSADRLLTALCAIGLIEKRPDRRFVNRPEAAEQLVRGRPGYIGAMFDHLRKALYPVWAHLGDALREEKPQWERAFPGQDAPTESHYSDPAALRAFMEGMHAITYRTAVELAALAPELRDVRTLVDVGGAGGAFVIGLAQALPALQGVVFDLPPVQPIAEDFFCRYGLSDRLRFHPGDFWADPLPPRADAYSLGFVLHDWDELGGSIVLDKIAQASRPGGLLLVGEFLLNDDRTGPLFVARQDLNMLVAARGRERSAPEYRQWLAKHGFSLEKIYPVSNGKNYMVARAG